MPATSSPALRFLNNVCWLGVLIWAATVFYLSSRSSADLVADLPFLMEFRDKVLHFIAFFCGVLPLVPALRLTYGWPWKKVCLYAVAATSLYGAIDEVHQLWTPSRSGLSVGDWLADTLGAIAGAPLAAFVHAFFERSNRTTAAAN